MILDIGLRLVFAIAVAFAIAYAATPIVKTLSLKIGAIDIPKDERRMHKRPIPTIGGVAIFYGALISILCFCNVDSQLMGVLLGAVIIVSLGVLDDILDLSALFKFLIQILAALLVVLHGVKIEYVTNPFVSGQYISLGMWAVPLTVFWIVGVTNAFNLIDGLDGLSVGVSAISAISLFSVAILTGETNLAIVAAAIAGSCFGFLPYNKYPASIFMGDAGSTFLGFVFGSISVMGLFKGYAAISICVPFLILALPIFDTSFAIIRRLLKGQSPMHPDRGHLHHRLIDMGFNQRQSVTILCIASGLLSLSAVVLILSGFERAFIFIFAVMVLMLAGLKVLAIHNKERGDEVE